MHVSGNMASWEFEDSTYSSTSEAEPDSDHEFDGDPDDPDKLLGTWLGELENLQLGIDGVVSTPKLSASNGNRLAIPTPRMDSYRFSMANLEDSQDVELDAILGELCALETQFDREITHKGHVTHCTFTVKSPRASISTPVPGQIISPLNGALGICHQGTTQPPQKYISHSRSNSGGTRPKFEIGGLHVDLDGDDGLRVQKPEFGIRTDSPDNDSAFSDNVSMLSSESSASSGGLPRTETSSQSMSSQSSSMSLASSPTQAEQAAQIKAEKIKIALEKIREASIKKLFIKAFSADNSAKSLLIDERMTVGHVTRLLAEKNHIPMDTKWAVVESIPELYMERIYEDHENLVENLLLWTRDSCNRILFLEKVEKYDLFINPQEYLLSGTSSEKDAELDDDARTTLIEEFFSSSGVGVPEVEGPLYLKSDGKKAWKKHFFVLRASGLYYCPKGKSKLSKDLLCLTTFEMNNVYVGFGWKKKYKSPTDCGFSIKHPQIQTKSSKYIKYLCAEDEKSLQQWVMGIRIAKYGRQLKENYDNLQRDIAEEDLDTLAHARSFSVSSMAKTLAISPESPSPHGYHNAVIENGTPFSPCGSSYPEISDMDSHLNQNAESSLTPTTPTTVERIRQRRPVTRQDSIKSSASSSSGCLSEHSSTGTPTMDQIAFDADFPMGTIKRKPSMTPKIPLTNTTRNIAKQSGDDNVVNLDTVSLSSSSSGGSYSGSLGRAAGARIGLHRSHTDDRITFGSINKKTEKQTSLEFNASSPSKNYSEDLPLPPPPPELGTSLESISADSLPPPPPEAFKTSTLSLDSLPPPPPPPSQLDEDASWPSTSSLNSLPPPPSPLLHTPTNENLSSTSPIDTTHSIIAPTVPPRPVQKSTHYQRTDVNLSERSVSLQDSNPKNAEFNSMIWQAKHRLNLDIPSANCYSASCRNSSQNSTPSTPPHNQLESVSPKLRSRRTSAPSIVSMHFHLQSLTSPTTPTPTSPKSSAANRKSRSQHKPPPPKRSENTKLTSAFTAPARRSSSASAAPHDQAMCPPESFLRDLQRVMVRKWKVAQQLSVDLTATPHQILGFRDPCYLPPAALDCHRSPRSPSSPPPLPHHSEKSSRSLSQSRHYQSRKVLHDSSRTSGTPKKRPPPPPPKRNDGAHLSRW